MSADSSTITMPLDNAGSKPSPPDLHHFKPIVARSESVGGSSGEDGGGGGGGSGGGGDREQGPVAKKLDLSISKGLLAPNSASMESPSPAGSIEQYEAAVTPLSPDDDMEGNREACLSTSGGGTGPSGARFESLLNNPSFKFRRHSSQSSLNMPTNLSVNMSGTGSASGSLTLLPTTGSVSTTTLSERICSVSSSFLDRFLHLSSHF